MSNIPPLQVLIVDDEPTIRDLLRTTLSDIVKAALPPSAPDFEDPRDLTREYPMDLS